MVEGLMVGKLVRGRTTRAIVAVALVATVFAVSSNVDSGAVPQTKQLVGTCGGADDASRALLAAFGGSLSVPFTVTSDVPATLDPEAPDQPISFTWGVTLAASVTSQVAAIDPSLTIKDMVLDMSITGPTSTTEVQGRPPTQELAVQAGVPATLTQGPFTGTLTDIGKGGIIKYSPKSIGFTISIDIAGAPKEVKVSCAAPGTVATTQIKIPGSPDITQPISLSGTANTPLLVDVLGQYVKPGKDENGVEMPVKPETLKVIDGPGEVVNGQVQVTPGAAGTTSSVTFEVCSGELPGTNEVQQLTLDTSGNALRKGVAFTLAFGDQTTGAIDELQAPFTFTPTNNWKAHANEYVFTPFQLPSPADVQNALERLPNIGAGGVSVTKGDHAGVYNIEFTNQNGQKDVDGLALGHYYSVFPQEVLTDILTAAQALLNAPKDPNATTTTFPNNVTLDQYVAQLEAKLQSSLANNDYLGWINTFQVLVPLKLQQGLANIDVNAAIAALTGLFSAPPTLTTTTAGDAPIGICSQGIIDVNVAGVEGTNTGGPGTDVAGTSTTNSGANLAFTG